MEYLKKLGNIEFCNCFLAWHYRKHGFFKKNNAEDPRINIYKKDFGPFFEKLLQISDEDSIDNDICEEAKVRGLGENFEIEPYKDFGLLMGLAFSDEVWVWQDYMLSTPTYIREIYANDNPGGSTIVGLDRSLDFPVREACAILKEKGYSTYWSSANEEDFKSRLGHVVKDKRVAYILIDPKDLDDELKDKLRLDGSSSLWGVALAYRDNGSYYGIWSEITSLNMDCLELSHNLSKKAIDLPSLGIEQPGVKRI